MVFAVAVAIPTALAAQAPDSLTLQGRNLLVFDLGLIGSRDVSVGPGGTTVRSTGQVASLAFTRFVRPSLGLEVSGALLDADAFSGSAQGASAVTALLFGVSYVPRGVAITRNVRPFASAAFGPYYQSASQASGSSSYASSQTRLGALVGLGLMSYVTSHFVLQVETYYHSVANFPAINNVTTDPSGFGTSIGLGLAWGSH